MRWDVSPVVTLHFCTSQRRAACSVVVNVREGNDGGNLIRRGPQQMVQSMQRLNAVGCRCYAPRCWPSSRQAEGNRIGSLSSSDCVVRSMTATTEGTIGRPTNRDHQPPAEASPPRCKASSVRRQESLGCNAVRCCHVVLKQSANPYSALAFLVTSN